MRRAALAVAALLLAASPALAAGAYVTRTVNDVSGAHLQSYWDESGVGVGPFDPVTVPLSGAGAVTNTPAGGSTMLTSQVSCTTTAAQISAAGSFNHRELVSPSTNTAQAYYGGTSSVTAATGMPFGPAGSTGDLSRYTGALYVVCAATQPIALVTY